MLDGTEFFECQCGGAQDTLRFILDFDSYCDGSNEPEIYTEIYIQKFEWYERIWVAIKYIFGYKLFLCA